MAAKKSSRIESIDFWRGVVLVAIFIDHVPGNPFGLLTPRNFGFSDSAEAFVFVSGLVHGYVSWPSVQGGKHVAVAKKCLKRAGQLYLVQVGLSLVAVVAFGAAFLAGGGHAMIRADNRAFFFQHPAGGLLGLLLLSYQFGYFNILSVYVVLMLMAAGFVVLLRRSPPIAFVLSLALYLATRLGLMLPSWPVPFTWFLNPFSWQFLFMLGMGAGALRRSGPLPRIPVVFAAACAYLAFGLVVATDAFGLWPGINAVVGPHLETDKSILGFARLLHFLAVAYVFSQLGVGEALLRRVPGAGLVSEIGRHGLWSFAIGSVLSAVGQIALRLAPPAAANPVVYDGVGAAVIILGIAVMIAAARLLTWRRALAAAASDYAPAE